MPFANEKTELARSPVPLMELGRRGHVVLVDKGFELTDTTLHGRDGAVLSACHHFQILKTVVVFYTVQMMNVLVRLQSAAKVLLHYVAMLIDISALVRTRMVAHGESDIAARSDAPAALPVRSLRSPSLRGTLAARSGEVRLPRCPYSVIPSACPPFTALQAGDVHDKSHLSEEFTTGRALPVNDAISESFIGRLFGQGIPHARCLNASRLPLTTFLTLWPRHLLFLSLLHFVFIRIRHFFEKAKLFIGMEVCNAPA